MNTQPAVGIILFLFMEMRAFVLSLFQFRGKGFLLNNAYILASNEERQKLDREKERKRKYYHQSGFVFLLLGITFLLFAVYMAVHWIWLLVAFWTAVVITVLYAVISSIKNELRK